MATAEERLGWGPGGGMGEPSYVIRRARLEDVEEVAAIEASAFSNPWHSRTFRALIQQNRAHILVARDQDGTVLGYAVTWWVQDEAELANLAVRDGHRGRGIGSALLDRVLLDLSEAGVASLFLEVRMSNDPALALYRSRGFVQVAVRKDYYRNPREDARILLKVLRSDSTE